MIRKSRQCLRFPHQSIAIPSALLLAYIFSSMVWSEEPSTTIKRGILVACIVTGCWGLGKAWSLSDFCRAILYVSGALLVAGIVAEIRYGTFLSLGETDYRFSGVLHPARTAFSCSLMAIAAFTLFRQENKSRFLLVALIAIAFTVLTKARTGTGALFVASCWFWFKPQNFLSDLSLIHLYSFVSH